VEQGRRETAKARRREDGREELKGGFGDSDLRGIDFFLHLAGGEHFFDSNAGEPFDDDADVFFAGEGHAGEVDEVGCDVEYSSDGGQDEGVVVVEVDCGRSEGADGGPGHQEAEAD
jgi:hypothetical protein